MSLRSRIEAELGVVRDGSAAERVARVAEKLGCEAVVVAGDREPFTIPGGPVFLGRAFVDELFDDDSVAFAIASEHAHQELGHLAPIPPVPRIVPLDGVLDAIRWYAGLGQQDADADRLAIERCFDAGYDPYRVLRAFDAGDLDPRHPLAERRARLAEAIVAIGRRERIDVAGATAQARRARRQRFVLAAGGSLATLAILAVRRR